MSQQVSKSLMVGDYPIIGLESARARKLSLKTNHRGIVLVKPKYISWRRAIAFAGQNANWIQKHYTAPVSIHSGSTIGRGDKLIVKTSNSFRKTIRDRQIIVSIPESLNASSDEAQRFIYKACVEALRKQTKAIINDRLPYWENMLKLNPNSIRIRATRSRWGSCSSKGNVSFSVYLSQLDDQIIDYVIVHELAHLIHHNHQSSFWKVVEDCIPDYKQLRKLLKTNNLSVQPK